MTITIPMYTETTRRMAILQQLQLLSAQPRTVTFAEIAAELEAMSQEYGANCSLESIIQRHVGEHIAAQLSTRQQLRQEVAA